MSYRRRDWLSVTNARVERAIGRCLRTIPMLRYRGTCLGCGAGLAQHHDLKCPAAGLELALLEHRGRISAKEVNHFQSRPSQAKAAP